MLHSVLASHSQKASSDNLESPSEGRQSAGPDSPADTQ
jgi:hypothetical protein